MKLLILLLMTPNRRVAAIQRPQPAREVDIVKFSKGKCGVLHLWRNNPGHKHRLGADLSESRSAEKVLGAPVGL